MSVAASQQQTFLRLLAALRPRWRTDRALPAFIQQRLARERAFGARDRRLYRELLYTTLRHRPWIEPWLDREPARAVKIAAWLAADTRDAFVALLGGGDAMVPMVELLDEHGLLVRYLPEWDRVRCKPQRNAFHRFTVDRHLLEAVARADDEVRSVRRPDLLLVGALLHDLGKGLPGDHTDNGIALAATVATRMGFAPDDVSA